MTGLLLAVIGAYGVHLVYSHVALGWNGVGPGDRRPTRRSFDVSGVLRNAGLPDARPRELAAALVMVSGTGAALAFACFGGVLAPVVGAGLALTIPIAAGRARHQRARAEARNAWPTLIEQIRLGATSLGQSIPVALFEAGGRSPEVMVPAFDAAQREWQLTTNFERSLEVLKAGLADATADTVCETLLVAFEIGGSEIERALGALVEDRIADLEERRDADARQSGARFARWFVLIVPLGMAAVGLGIGSGRAAYGSASAQLAVAAALVTMAGCWIWAGRIMRLPPERRVFAAISARYLQSEVAR